MARLRPGLPQPHWRLPVLVLLVGLAASAGVYVQQVGANQARAQAAFDELAEHTRDRVQQRMRQYEYGLRGARGTVVALASNRPRAPPLRATTAPATSTASFPGARGFGVILRVAQADEAEFIAHARADDWPDFQIRQLSPHDGERYVIQYIEPVAANRAAIGLDIASEAHRRQAAEQAAHSGQATLTAPITLVQAGGAAQRAFLLLLPIYRTPDTPATLPLRAQLNWAGATRRW